MSMYVCRCKFIWICREKYLFLLSVICTLLTQKLDMEKGREHSTVNGFHSHESSWPQASCFGLSSSCLKSQRSGSLVTDLGAGREERG